MGSTDDGKRIINDAVKYDFYPEDIQLYVAAILCNQIYTNQFTDQFNGFRFDVNNWGWAIVLEKDDFVEVRFIFVYPEFRRQWNFKRLIDSLKTREKKIIVCSNKPIMVRSLISLGFKLDGKSMNEKELRYVINL